ncbi:Flavin-dependent oxidoreductase, luciferase family (includes alkanesulfonate monooxygenase SsuD and methylene tetrahydromethanopterin reductase) [Rhodococcus rhodochrous J3]|uniref:LLM class flavin-dependent oxidoreductase n=2 Tax=Rhodococcus rhodochrous TaxID=1829 RepID=A0AA46X3E8_RHORH|nr:LLM class flavin-dependent oxidoreductase [Rhodococcus rhodochrous]MBF4476508.1 LLM class flavin-dependent oxidoreductase [Rhodococcus rhodochrous]MCD2099289.1 LLM class flavin-dependent oxidoreductase [Rhodococcus rhodochrous]MCD2123706.1 LLM class flavin-dependent oxidoreductase [Rhodococcus rhodochrous]MCQ4136265.1 LLM class flavin-dependent oxidoreductase [Rhodococcus rhodochrous]MDJ0020502.1 LLM class flavin-dependent oxidoreductase [Rhodococcus rhodochrous]
MTVQFGVFVPQFRIDFDGMRTRAIAAEDAGFDSFWLMDHLYAPGGKPTDSLESWTLLTALAGATSTIRLGHLVGCNPLRHPALLAKMAATVDNLSGGRLDLGLGWGSVEAEFDMFGIPVGSRRERAESLGETLEIFRKMCTGEPFDYDGRHFTLRGAYGLPVPTQSRIPVHIGGGGKQLTMPLVAEHADWWNCLGSARHRIGELAPLRGGARISAQYAVGFAHDIEQLPDVAAATARRMPAQSWGAPLVGTAEMLIDQLDAERERGVELFVLRFHDFAEPETLELFGRDVIAKLS